MNQFCVCIVSNSEWAKLEDTLKSLQLSRQNNYDVIIVNNTGSEQDENSLKDWAATSSLSLKNIFFLNKCPISVAWNVGFITASQYDYKWIVKLDAGTVLKDTAITRTKKPNAQDDEFYRPPEYMDQGAVAGFITGAGSLKKKKRNVVGDPSMFINILAKYCEEKKIGIGSLLAVPEGGNFSVSLGEAAKVERKGNPYLLPGCMAISIKTLNKIGFMDERLNAQLETEYSIRAVENGISIGYFQESWVTIPAVWSEPESTVEDNQRALRFIDNYPLKEKPDSIWFCMVDRLKSCSDNNLVVNIKNIQLETVWQNTDPDFFE